MKRSDGISAQSSESKDGEGQPVGTSCGRGNDLPNVQ